MAGNRETKSTTTRKANNNKRRSKKKEEWRRYGAERRKELVAKDESQGGTSFEMRKNCQIERYFRLAEKVLADFQKKCEDSTSDLEETYVMGHRLKAFLGTALPQHPHYRKNQVTHLRLKSQRNLEWIKEQMQAIALKIDEDQLNTYITMDFDPDPDDFSTSSSSSESEEGGFADFRFTSLDGDAEWQDFSGWNHASKSPFAEVPLSVETDSSRSHDLNSSNEEDESEEDDGYEQPSCEMSVSDLPTDDEDDERTVEEPQTFVTFQDEANEEDSGQPGGFYDGPSEFFRRIADEAINSTAFYESDSEAVDSWAQDGETCASSGTALTACDPARLAFAEIMNKVPHGGPPQLFPSRNPASASRPLPPPPVPAFPPRSILALTTTRTENDEDNTKWAAFGGASVLQEPSPVSAGS